MTRQNTFFMIPSSSVPADATYEVWFASWSSDLGGVTWSQTRPAPAPSASTACIGVVSDRAIPAGAQLLGTGGKDLPPPSPDFVLKGPSVSDFQQAFQRWLAARTA